MVALVVTGFVVIAAHATLTAMTDAWSSSREARERVLNSVGRRAQLESWLRSAVLLDGVGSFRGRHQNVGGIPRDELTFAVVDGGPLRPGAHRVHLWIDHDPSTAQRGLVAELAVIRGSMLAPPETLEVVPEADGLALRYLVHVGVEDEWVATWESDERLPRSIDLRLVDIAAIRLGAATVSDQGMPPLLGIPIVVPVAREGR
jgi:hypothetical protein